MKLKNIFLSTLAVLACAACSKDDETSRIEGADASVSIVVKAMGSGKTKAYNPNDVNELEGEAKVNSLVVLIFDANNDEQIGYKWEKFTSEGEATINNVESKTGTARIVIVSNVAENELSGITTYSDFEARLAKLENQKQDNLVMSSQVITTQSALVKGDNYLGFSSQGTSNINGIDKPVEITRLAARIDMISAKTNFTKTSLVGRTVRVDEVSVLKQNTVSHYFSESYWGAVMAKGSLADSPITTIGRNISNGSAIDDTPYVHYVMENDASEGATQIQIKATLLETATHQAEVKYFTSIINKDGLLKGYDHNYVKRNYVYRLNITFGDNSFDGTTEKDPDDPNPPITPPTPTTGELDVQVEVVNWGPVSQDVEI